MTVISAKHFSRKTSSERKKTWKLNHPERSKATQKNYNKNYREKLKNTLTLAEKEVERQKNVVRQRRFIAKRKQEENQTLISSPVISPQVKGKLLKRARKVLTGTKQQNVEILKSLMSENISDVTLTTLNSTSKKLPESTVKKVIDFFLNDEISRASPNGFEYVTIKEDGQKKKISVRHLIYTVKESHGMFCKENPEVKIGLSKFFEIKPINVLSFSKMPHNVCCCQIHENIRCCLKTLKTAHPIFSDLYTDNDMHKNFVCDKPTNACYANECEYCLNSWKLRELEEEIQNPSQTVSWFKWVKTDKTCNTDSRTNIYSNIEKVKKVGTIHTLLEEIYDKVSDFLDHQYVKMNQARSSSRMIQEAKEQDTDSAVIIIDFAEKFKCMQQNATQSAHYGQTPVSILTIAIYHKGFRPMAIASDFEKHTKDAVLAYLDFIIEKLPPSVKRIEMWSDNATSQFKNQYIMEGIKSFEQRHGKKIRWNFYAPMHGKSVVDGIGGSVKRYVRERILAKDLLVNSAEDFVAVASTMEVEVILMKSSDIEARNKAINLPKIIKSSNKIADIKKNHSFRVSEVKIGKKQVLKIVSEKISI